MEEMFQIQNFMLILNQYKDFIYYERIERYKENNYSINEEWQNP